MKRKIILLIGDNGSGKTTFAQKCLDAPGMNVHFLNHPTRFLFPSRHSPYVDEIVHQWKSGQLPPTILFETHSDIVLNHIGELVDKKILHVDEVVVYLFKNGDFTEKFFNNDGTIIDWEIGFMSP